MQFSPGGTLLATASVAGHSINVFSIVPPTPPELPTPEAGGGGFAAGGCVAPGHAVWLYRLYRGVTPAAISGIAFAPDASWVAVSSGRGTTHVFRTPSAAPGATPPEAAGSLAVPEGTAGEAGVLGRPPKLLAVGRARKPGLLSGGAAGAATSAARQLYSRQPAGGRRQQGCCCCRRGAAVRFCCRHPSRHGTPWRPPPCSALPNPPDLAGAGPIAAAFMAGGPRSPQGAGAGSADGHSAGSSLYVVTHDGLLTRHLLRVPAAENGAAGGPAVGSAAGLPHPMAGQPDGAARPGAGGAAAAPPVLEEADRWDVARHASWPEGEELLPGLAASTPESLASGPNGSIDGGPAIVAPVDAAQQQVWVSQAEAGALAGCAAAGGVGGGGGGAPLPLWGDPQFRFFELRVQQLQRQRSAATGGAEAAPPCAPADAGDATPAWLEQLPARPVQQ